MNGSIEKRIGGLERQTAAERKVIAENRNRILSMVDDFMRISEQPLEEARRFFLRCLPPELAAHLADDWETNPLTMEALRILNQPNGHFTLYAKSLENCAAASGLEADDLLLLMLLDVRFAFEHKLSVLRLAHQRGVRYAMVNLHGRDDLAEGKAAAQRRAEIDAQARQRLAAKGYAAEEIEQIVEQAEELRAKFWEIVDEEEWANTVVCTACGAANDLKARVARSFSAFLAAEGFTPEQCEQTLAGFSGGMQ